MSDRSKEPEKPKSAPQWDPKKLPRGRPKPEEMMIDRNAGGSFRNSFAGRWVGVGEQPPYDRYPGSQVFPDPGGGLQIRHPDDVHGIIPASLPDRYGRHDGSVMGKAGWEWASWKERPKGEPNFPVPRPSTSIGNNLNPQNTLNQIKQAPWTNMPNNAGMPSLRFGPEDVPWRQDTATQNLLRIQAAVANPFMPANVRATIINTLMKGQSLAQWAPVLLYFASDRFDMGPLTKPLNQFVEQGYGKGGSTQNPFAGQLPPGSYYDARGNLIRPDISQGLGKQPYFSETLKKR